MGPLLCFELLTILAVLRSRRDLRWSLAAGLGLSLLALTKGIFGLQIAVIALIFLYWDTPRLLTCRYYWGGLALGAIPSGAWYVSQWFKYHQSKTTLDFINLFLGNIASGNSYQLPQYYLLDSLQYILPWLIIVFLGLKVAPSKSPLELGQIVSCLVGYISMLGISIVDRKLVYPTTFSCFCLSGRQTARFNSEFT